MALSYVVMAGRRTYEVVVLLLFFFAVLLLLALPLHSATESATEEDLVARSFCDVPPYKQLCSVAPNDNTDFDSSLIYINIAKAAQDPFDIFSWQTFVALNWPADADGKPANHTIGGKPDAPRVWQFYTQPRQKFGDSKVSDICGDSSNPTLVATSDFLQTTGYPLIDRNLNYAVYDIRINDVSEQYLAGNGLLTAAGQEQFAQAQKAVEFPLGFYSNVQTRTGGDPGATELKMSWKIVDTDAGDDPGRYYTVDGRIAVPAEFSETGEPMCIETRLGLMGMHIMRRTQSGNGNEWIWSTFEHRDVAPIAENALDPNNFVGRELFPGGCQAGSVEANRYLFFDEACPNCPTNSLNAQPWKWAAKPPYARQHATGGKFGSQAVRCWSIFASTAAANTLWQQKLKDTIWSNYRLVTTQWRGGQQTRAVPDGEVPRFLTNVTIETYDQYSSDGTCIGCHKKAATLAGQNANFSFVPRMVR